MSAIEQQPITTFEEYNLLSPDIRAEVFDGQIQYMSSPSQIHQTILLELSSFLHHYVKEKNGVCKVFPAPFDVKLSDNPLTIVQPDIMIVCDQSKLDGKRCNGAPDFIIEIVSPNNPSDDYIRKLYYYQKYGVREYWIVDARRRLITVYYFEEELINISYSFDSVVKVHIYEDLYVDFFKIDINV